MTLQQGIELAQMAKAKNLAVRVKDGNVQLITVTYAKNGNSTIVEKSGWVGYEEAKELMAAR